MADRRLLRGASLTLGVALAVLAGGCASDGAGQVHDRHAPGIGQVSTTSAPVSTLADPRGAVPPLTGPALDEVVNALLAPHGWEVERASWVHAQDAQRSIVLSIYTRPRRALSDDEYAQAMAPLAVSVIPVLVRRYPSIGAIDLCQEPFEVPDTDAEPPPTTRVFMYQLDVKKVDWTSFGLTDLLRAAATPSDGGRNLLELFSVTEVRNTPTWREAASKL